MRIVVIGSLLVLLASPRLVAQAPIVRLSTPTATLAEEFSAITGVTELRDGRVLVSDRREKRVVVADFAKGTVGQVGRAGEGPLEYSSAEAVWVVGGDSGIMFLPPQRWVLFSGGRLTGILGPDAEAVRLTRTVVRGTDTLGHVLSAPIFAPASPQSVQADSVPLLLTSRGSARVDTIARLKTYVPRRNPIEGMPGYFQFFPPTLAMFETPGQAVDGWTAIVRTAPYRVDWRMPSGQWVKGQPIRVPLVEINEREKLFYLERNPDPSQPSRTPASITDWPATVPAVGNPRMVSVAPDGRVLVPRQPSANQPETRYDIVNRRGQLEAELVLPASESIIAFGLKSAYVIQTDADGIRHLRRHAWPPVPSK